MFVELMSNSPYTTRPTPRYLRVIESIVWGFILWRFPLLDLVCVTVTADALEEQHADTECYAGGREPEVSVCLVCSSWEAGCPGSAVSV